MGEVPLYTCRHTDLSSCDARDLQGYLARKKRFSLKFKDVPPTAFRMPAPHERVNPVGPPWGRTQAYS